jgi:DNA-directed RNA polymerase specialized sigma24 family protein
MLLRGMKAKLAGVWESRRKVRNYLHQVLINEILKRERKRQRETEKQRQRERETEREKERERLRERQREKETERERMFCTE